MTAQSEAWIGFARLNAGIVGSNPTPGMDACVSFFCVCAVLCVGSGLESGWSTIQGVLPTVYRIKKLKSGQGQAKSCRATVIIITDYGLLIWIRYPKCWTVFSKSLDAKQNQSEPDTNLFSFQIAHITPLISVAYIRNTDLKTRIFDKFKFLLILIFHLNYAWEIKID
jgi:hypothetical protein